MFPNTAGVVSGEMGAVLLLLYMLLLTRKLVGQSEAKSIYEHPNHYVIFVCKICRMLHDLYQDLHHPT